MNAPAIEIRGLKKSFRNFSLGPLDLTVPAGAIYGLIGPNGSGKSTTLDLLFGMGGKDAGSMRAAGFDHERQEADMKRLVTYSSPATSFNAWGKVGRIIRFVQGFYPNWDAALCARLMEAFQLSANDKISLLSFGMTTRLSLLLALCPRPQVVVLDEPTTGLDPEARQILFNELLCHVQDENRTVLISSHQLADLERYTDHIGILHQGRMLCEGATADIVMRHRIVEYSLTGKAPPEMPGFYPRRSGAGRCLAVVDTTLHPATSLAARGLDLHSQIDVSLEEIFLAMTSKQKEAA
jgi:ABC-2 type transport system ATP-binding protein